MTNRPGPLGQRIAAELRAELGRQDQSRRWLAEQIGAPHNTVARWVGGETPPPLDALDAMCRALGISVADLLAAVERNGGYEPVVVLPRRPRVGPVQAGHDLDNRNESVRNTDEFAQMAA